MLQVWSSIFKHTPFDADGGMTQQKNNDSANFYTDCNFININGITEMYKLAIADKFLEIISQSKGVITTKCKTYSINKSVFLIFSVPFHRSVRRSKLVIFINGHTLNLSQTGPNIKD